MVELTHEGVRVDCDNGGIAVSLRWRCAGVVVRLLCGSGDITEEMLLSRGTRLCSAAHRSRLVALLPFFALLSRYIRRARCG